MLNSFNRLDLIKAINQKKGFSLPYSKKLIEDLIFFISDEIKFNTLILKNIGTFKRKFKDKRIGRNPKTNKPYLISARKSVSFIPSRNLLKKLNNK